MYLGTRSDFTPPIMDASLALALVLSKNCLGNHSPFHSIQPVINCISGARM